MSRTAETVAVTGGRFRVGEWLVEPSLNRLSRGDTAIQLELKVMDVLVCLAERAGEVVTRQEIVDRVWATEFISDNTLTHAIAEIRKALDDDAREPRYIETIPRRGYRLVAEVTSEREASALIQAAIPPFKLQDSDGDYPLAQNLNVIGRAADAHVCIDRDKVSRHHAKIVIEGTTATIEDLDSKNGTFLNGSRLECPATLTNGDEIWIGHDVATIWFSIDGKATETETSQ